MEYGGRDWQCSLKCEKCDTLQRMSLGEVSESPKFVKIKVAKSVDTSRAGAEPQRS